MGSILRVGRGVGTPERKTSYLDAFVESDLQYSVQNSLQYSVQYSLQYSVNNIAQYIQQQNIQYIVQYSQYSQEGSFVKRMGLPL